MSAWTALGRADVGSGGAATIEFSNISSSYSDLVIHLSVRGNQASAWDWLTIAFNGNAANYSSRRFYGSGSSVSSNSQSTSSYIENGLINGNSSTSNIFANVLIYISNYAGSSNKIISIESVSENNATEAYILGGAGLWSNTSAISSITLDSAAGGTWQQYSSATLYGILKGSSGGVTVT
jgi:hypothetical protein